ncbi:hypothetical protein BDF19DRAFT_333626, partial [Syncephalis fuscata]
KTGQKYQNTDAFRHNRASKKTTKILAMPITHVCTHCREVLEWRKQYRKYKPLTQPKKCLRCNQKAIKQAYHVICVPCATKHRLCAKCNKEPFTSDKMNDAKSVQAAKLEQERLLASMTERQRRTYLRQLERGDDMSGGSEDDEDEDSNLSASDAADEDEDESEDE